MNRMASNHPDLKVFLVDWKKKIELDPYTHDKDKNTIFYFL